MFSSASTVATIKSGHQLVICVITLQKIMCFIYKNMNISDAIIMNQSENDVTLCLSVRPSTILHGKPCDLCRQNSLTFERKMMGIHDIHF